MATCQICKRDFNRLRFTTSDIKICTHCVTTLNKYREPAVNAQNRFGDLLAKGMRRRATHDLESPDEWKRENARWELENFEAAHARAMPGWLKRRLADSSKSERDYKILRAYRRGLLRLEGGLPWHYPGNWPDVAKEVRSRDGRSCQACGTDSSNGVVLDVHHIIYLSNFGTNQRKNLVTLCRPCHEREHGRFFDFGEPDDPESPDPIQPKPSTSPPLDIVLDTRTEATFNQDATGNRPDRSPAEHSPVWPSSCDQCGAPLGKIFSVTHGDILRCTGCGYVPSRQSQSRPPGTQISSVSPSKGDRMPRKTFEHEVVQPSDPESPDPNQPKPNTAPPPETVLDARTEENLNQHTIAFGPDRAQPEESPPHSISSCYQCGGPLGTVFSVVHGDILRCIGCGYVPGWQFQPHTPDTQSSKAVPSEGHYMLRKASEDEAVEGQPLLNASPSPQKAGASVAPKKVERRSHSSNHAHRIPESEAKKADKTDEWALLIYIACVMMLLALLMGWL